MFFKKGVAGGFFKKATDVGHLGVKALSHPILGGVVNYIAPNSNVAEVSGVLQKIK